MENPDVVFIKVDVDYCEDLGLDFQAKLPVVPRAPTRAQARSPSWSIISIL